jgi:hypothetical protein
MKVIAPPERLVAAPQFSGWEETIEAKEARYLSIANDIAQVAYDPDEQPAFAGRRGRQETAALLLAIAFKESGFAHDVDKGPCVQHKDRKTGYVRCDGGASACMMQIRIGAGTTKEGWTQRDLFADRTKCFRAGLSLVRRSMNACREHPVEYRLNAYASGVCSLGHSGSKDRMRYWRKLLDMPGRPKIVDALLMPKPVEAPSGSKLAAALDQER